jgi:pyruvate/2-oxoglutarate dehydrogenase complex dihydrolipoamide acyltransferase (E2) component
MSVDVLIPLDLWEEQGEGVIGTWLFQNGETVDAGAVLAEVMYEKASMEVLSPSSGTLQILLAAETPVIRGQLIARIE